MTTETIERRVNADMVTRDMTIVPQSWNEEARTIDVVWTTGARGARFIWARWEWIDEELATDTDAVRLDRLNGGAPVLNTHLRYELGNQIGVVVPGSARMEGGKGYATLQISDREDVQPIARDIASGIIRNVSVGYVVHTYEITEREGQRALYRAVDWEPTEISFVPVPFDKDAQTRSADAVQGGFPCIIRGKPAAAHEEQTMSQKTIGDPAGNAGTRENNQPGEGGQPSEQERAAPGQQSADGANKPAPVQPSGTAVIKRFGASEALSFVEEARVFGDDVARQAQDLVNRNERGDITIDAARSELLKAAGNAQRQATGTVAHGGGNAQINRDERDKWLQGASNAIIARAGLTDLVARAAKERGEEVDLNPGEFRGIRNAELARMALERSGFQVRSYDRDEIVRDALTLRTGPYQSTSDFPVLLENVMHKVLQAAYATQPDTWRRFCGVGSVSDFRPHNRYLRGMFGALDSLNENGEFKNKQIPDGLKELISATTKGNIIGLTRQAIVNDDLSAFNQLATELGRAAKLSVEIDVYALLAENTNLGPNMNDGNPLFDASHNNIAGTAAAPSVTSFEAMEVQMASQKDVSDKEFLDIRPAVWLGPLGLRGDALVINDAQFDPDTANKLQKPNKVRGLFRDIVGTPRLSGTRWYGFADPDVAPAIEVVFLDGQQEPILEMKDGWRTDGTEWRVKFDYGVGAINWRSAATNAGA